MSRHARTRCGYAFRPTPLELEPQWLNPEVSFYARMLGRELHATFGPEPVTYSGDWREFACRRMMVSGRDRTMAKRALAELAQRCLVVVESDRFRVQFAPSSHPDDIQIDTSSHPELTQPPENTQVRLRRSEIDQEKIKRESESARAQDAANDSQRAAESDALSLCERRRRDARAMLRVEFSKRFQAAEGSPWTQGGMPALDVLAGWLVAMPEPGVAMRKLLDGFFADPWCRSQHFPITHLGKYPQKYFEPRVAAVRDVTRGVFKPQPGDFRKWAPGEYENYIDNIFGDAPKAAAE